MFPVLASLHPSTGFSKCLSVQIGATALFLASSCYASKQHCNSIGNFCKWSFFLQWTFWNTVSRNLLQSVTSHCVVLHHSPAYRIASHMHCTVLHGCIPTSPTSAESLCLLHAPAPHVQAYICCLTVRILLRFRATLQVIVVLPGSFLGRSFLVFPTTLYPGNDELGMFCIQVSGLPFFLACLVIV